MKFIQRFARYRNAAVIWIRRLCSNSLESELTVPGRATIFSRYSHSYNIPIQSCILRPIHLHLLHLTQCSAYYIHWMERCHLSVFEVLFYDQSDLTFKVASYVSTIYVLSISYTPTKVYAKSAKFILSNVPIEVLQNWVLIQLLVTPHVMEKVQGQI